MTKMKKVKIIINKFDIHVKKNAIIICDNYSINLI